MAVVLEDGQNLYDIFVDGSFVGVLNTTGHDGKQQFNLAQGLSEGIHSIRLRKRTEAFFGVVRFYGFVQQNGQLIYSQERYALIPYSSSVGISFFVRTPHLLFV